MRARGAPQHHQHSPRRRSRRSSSGGPQTRLSLTTYFAPSRVSRRRVRRIRLALRLVAPRVRCSARRTRQLANGESRSWRRRRPVHHAGRVLLGEGDDIFYVVFFFSGKDVILDLLFLLLFFSFLSCSCSVVTLCSSCLLLSFMLVLVLYVAMVLVVISIWKEVDQTSC